jgi:hypothetical protein
MNLVSKPATTRLAYREMLKLRGRAGDRVDCLDGCVWITQEGDRRDILLDAGQGFMLDRAGTAIVYALRDAGVEVRRATSYA